MTARATFTGLLMFEVAALMLAPLLLPWPLLGGLIHLAWAATLVVAIARLEPGRRLLWIAVGLALLSELVRWTHGAGLDLMILPSLIADLALNALATFFIVRSIWTQKEVGADTIFGGIVGYLLLGLIFTLVYAILETLRPGALVVGVELRLPGSGAVSATQLPAQLIYFSFVTLTTLGYGDISPGSAAAASVAMLEAVTGQLYVAILIARLVAIASARDSQ